MKKISISLLTVILCFSFSTLESEASSQKVMWDGIELKEGQIGRVTMTKSGFSIFKMENGKMVPARHVKKGEVFRVYGIYRDEYTTNYALGANFYAYRSSHRKDGSNEYFQKNLKYETPSKAKQKLLNMR